METPAPSSVLEFLGLVFALVVSGLTALDLLSRLGGRASSELRAYIKRRRIKGLLIIPNQEELARYSAQIPQRISEEERIYQIFSRDYRRYFDEFRQYRFRWRLRLLAASAALGYFMLAILYTVTALM